MLNKLKIIALMPMKGISERVPNKNLKFFHNTLLYEIVLKNLIKSDLINEIIINTDSNKIVNDIKSKYDDLVKILMRPKNICGNYVSMNKIINYDIQNSDGDIYIQTHATNPLLTSKTIDSALKKMIEFNSSKDFDSIFSVTKIQKRFYNSDAKPINHDPSMLVTQNLESMYEDNSCFYIFSKKSFLENNHRIGKKPFMFELNKIESTDIDDMDDFVIAEKLYESFNK